jgi:putative tricarboxylic transport membrane protein
VLVFCCLGVYAVSSSTVDLWIMTGCGLLGWVLRKLDFEVAPIVLGLILSPLLETSVRQSLAMSSGSYAIFVDRPIAAILLGVALLLFLLMVRPARKAAT